MYFFVLQNFPLTVRYISISHQLDHCCYGPHYHDDLPRWTDHMHAIPYFQVSWPLVQRNQDWFTAVKYNKMSLIWSDINDKYMAYGHITTCPVFSKFQCVGYHYMAYVDLDVRERPLVLIVKSLQFPHNRLLIVCRESVYFCEFYIWCFMLCNIAF